MTYFTIRSSQLAHLPCPQCQTTLEIHQPNVDRPYQFLATCSACHGWFRIETRAGEARGIMASMPEISLMIASDDSITEHTA